VGVGDVLVRQLLEVRVFENLVERPDEIVIGAIAFCAVDRSEACDFFFSHSITL
jgi:hypothetical protein